jgi:hypothetical protein
LLRKLDDIEAALAGHVGGAFEALVVDGKVLNARALAGRTEVSGNTCPRDC